MVRRFWTHATNYVVRSYQVREKVSDFTDAFALPVGQTVVDLVGDGDEGES